MEFLSTGTVVKKKKSWVLLSSTFNDHYTIKLRDKIVGCIKNIVLYGVTLQYKLVISIVVLKQKYRSIIFKVFILIRTHYDLALHSLNNDGSVFFQLLFFFIFVIVKSAGDLTLCLH